MFSSNVRNQLLATVTGKLYSLVRKISKFELFDYLVNILQIGLGAVLGWTSAGLLVLESEDSPLPSGPITVVEKSLVSALMFLGGVLGCIFFGWASNKYGRKYPLMGAAFPQLVNIIVLCLSRISIQRTLIFSRCHFIFCYVFKLYSRFLDNHN